MNVGKNKKDHAGTNMFCTFDVTAQNLAGKTVKDRVKLKKGRRRNSRRMRGRGRTREDKGTNYTFDILAHDCVL